MDINYYYPDIKQVNHYYPGEQQIEYGSRADPSWSIERKIAWLKRREYLRNHKDVFIPEDRPGDRFYHHWWHTKGKYQSLKHYVDGGQIMY